MHTRHKQRWRLWDAPYHTKGKQHFMCHDNGCTVPTLIPCAVISPIWTNVELGEGCEDYFQCSLIQAFPLIHPKHTISKVLNLVVVMSQLILCVARGPDPFATIKRPHANRTHTRNVSELLALGRRTVGFIEYSSCPQILHTDITFTNCAETSHI